MKQALEELDSLKYLGSQVAADGGCERDVVYKINGYKAWGALKSVLSNRGLGIKAKMCLYEGVIVPKALYGAEAYNRFSWTVCPAKHFAITAAQIWYKLDLSRINE